ncbi:RsmB/NOP family class I SAM-dependent RNA methyltransferase [Desulfocurvibacter africanus]|uniref:Fmu (Sun) domain protein n=1 Tax=Desulfocurvibacter africanus subsp. africanus str. Walvis Bay TaxID=690850 RepID=F3YZN5_DESAF|nr:RsmB/NOP family class I SAM-dependent RNA methyltransferase [Desulfocurvibacter africanus]EGJ49734.1 Fmu (Sun) domain protein [Desulfocurvibacter africanus subsp. africanus str. Walvis Bay]
MRSFRIVAPAQRIPLVEALLRAEGFAFEPEPFAPSICRRLTVEPFALGESLAAFFGYVYIQDRSSMLPPLLLNPPEGAAVLDMCASPGSKTGLLAQLVGQGGFVLGNEPSRDRLETLRQNLRRMNLLQAATCTYSGERLPLAARSWKCIQLDPPCSGWGTVDKNPQVMTLWSPDKVEPLVRLQRELLRTAAELVAPGGRVLYSTCTTNVRENEEQTAWAAQELELEIRPLDPPAGFSFEPALGGLAGVLRVDQVASGAQGFFLACLEKPGSSGEAGESDESEGSGDERRARLPGSELRPASLGLADVFDWSLLPPGRIYDFGGKVFFLPEQALDLPASLRWQGYLLGKLAGKTLRPQARLRTMLREDGEVMRLDDPAGVRALLSGRSLEGAGHGAYAGLWCQGLPLGVLTRKGRRLLWAGG